MIKHRRSDLDPDGTMVPSYFLSTPHDLKSFGVLPFGVQKIVIKRRSKIPAATRVLRFVWPLLVCNEAISF